MSGHRTLAGVVYDLKQEVTSRARFLSAMHRVIPSVPLASVSPDTLAPRAHYGST